MSIAVLSAAITVAASSVAHAAEFSSYARHRHGCGQGKAPILANPVAPVDGAVVRCIPEASPANSEDPRGTEDQIPEFAVRRWEAFESRYGVLARDIETRAISFAVGHRSSEEAKLVALGRCVERGGEKCEVWFEFVNECIAVSKDVGGTNELRAWGNATPELVERAALDGCRRVGKQCEIVETACSSAEFTGMRDTPQPTIRYRYGDP